MDKKDFIESKIIKFNDTFLVGKVFLATHKEIQDLLTSSLNEAWEKSEEHNKRFYGLSSCEYEMIEDKIRQQQKEELIKWCEEMPTEFPERESDEYDTAYKDAKEYILTHLQELTK